MKNNHTNFINKDKNEDYHINIQLSKIILFLSYLFNLF